METRTNAVAMVAEWTRAAAEEHSTEAQESLVALDTHLEAGLDINAAVKAVSPPPVAACGVCGGWNKGGMSSHTKATAPVLGRIGCTCGGPR